MRNGVMCLVTALTMAATESHAWAQGNFVPLGVANTYVTGMSADGSVLVGVYGNLGPAWRWTQPSGVVNIGSISQTVAISADGKTIVGTANDDRGSVTPRFGKPAQNGIRSASAKWANTRWKDDRGVQRLPATDR
jgi:hypothetical protein